MRFLYTPDMGVMEVLELIVVGLAAGVLGGLLGIGGSIIMIPALTILLHRNMHLAQAAAMIVNFFVAVPSTWQHHRARAVRWDVVYKTLPFGIAFIVIGVIVGNTFASDNRMWGPKLLERLFGVFLLYVVVTNVYKLFGRSRNNDEPSGEPASNGWWRVGFVGSIVGFMAGLLGIGGGIVTVPLYQRVCHLPLRWSIATSSAVMCITAVFGAISKNASLHTHDIAPKILGIGPESIILESILIAACLTPSAIVGSLIGARLTHRLPLGAVRLAFILLLMVAGWRMLI